MDAVRDFRLLAFVMVGPVLVGFASQAFAADSGFYVGAGLGRTSQHVGNSTTMLETPASAGSGNAAAFVAIDTTFDVDGEDTGFNGTLGYRVNRYFAAELTYSDFGQAAATLEPFAVAGPFVGPFAQFYPSGTFTPIITRPPGASIVAGQALIFAFPLDFAFGVRGPTVSVLGTLPVGEQFGLFLRAGMLFAEQDVEMRVNSTPAFSSSTSDDVMLGGIGADWSFADRWTARLEYQRTDTISSNPFTGDIDLEQFSLAFLVRFGK